MDDELGYWYALVLVVDSQGKKIASQIWHGAYGPNISFLSSLVEGPPERTCRLWRRHCRGKVLKPWVRITRHNGFKMHATFISSNPPLPAGRQFSFGSGGCQTGERRVTSPRPMTMDAGPNVKILCPGQWYGAFCESLIYSFSSREHPFWIYLASYLHVLSWGRLADLKCDWRKSPYEGSSISPREALSSWRICSSGSW